MAPVIEAEANAFRIWREGQSVDWECTAQDLAEAVDLPDQTVTAICKKRKWPIQRSTSLAATDEAFA